MAQNGKTVGPVVTITQAEYDALQAKAAGRSTAKLSLRVSPKGGISVYGLQRWPVTLYAAQWDRVLGHGDAIKAFAKENAAKLATRDGE